MPNHIHAGELFEFSLVDGVRHLDIYDGPNSNPHTKIFSSKDGTEILLDYDNDSHPDTSILQAKDIEITRSAASRGIYRKLVIKRFQPDSVYEYQYFLDDFNGQFRLRSARKRPYRVDYKSELSPTIAQSDITCSPPSDKSISEARDAGEQISNQAARNQLEKTKQVDGSCPTSKVLDALTIVRNSKNSNRYLGCLSKFPNLKDIAHRIQSRIEAKIISFDAKASIVCTDTIPPNKFALFKENGPIKLRTSWVLESNADAIAEAIFHEQGHEAELPEVELREIETCCRRRHFESCPAANPNNPTKSVDSIPSSEPTSKSNYQEYSPARKLKPISQIYDNASNSGISQAELDNLDGLVRGTLEDQAKNLGCLTRRHPSRDCRKAFDFVLDKVFDRIKAFCSTHLDYQTCKTQLADEAASRREIIGNCTSNTPEKYRQCPYETRIPKKPEEFSTKLVQDQIALIPDEVHHKIGDAKSPSSDTGKGPTTEGRVDDKNTRDAMARESRAGLGSVIRHVADRAGREILPRAYADDSIRSAVSAERRASLAETSPQVNESTGRSFARQAPTSPTSGAVTSSTESIQQDRSEGRSNSRSSGGGRSADSSGVGVATYTSLQKRNSSGSRPSASGTRSSARSAEPAMPGDAIPSVAMVDSSLGGSDPGSDAGQVSVAGVTAPAHGSRNQPQANSAAQNSLNTSNRNSGQSSSASKSSQSEYGVAGGSSGGGAADSGRSVASFENSDVDGRPAPAGKASASARKSAPKELKGALAKVGLKSISNASETQIMKILRSAENPSAILAYEPVEERLNRLDLRIQAPDGTIYGKSGRKIRRLEDILKNKK